MYRSDHLGVTLLVLYFTRVERPNIDGVLNGPKGPEDGLSAHGHGHEL